METWQLDHEQPQPRRPQVLHSTAGANRVLALALQADEQLAEHEVREHALVFLIDGEITLTTTDREETLVAPALVYLEPRERHAVHAHRDSRLVICLAPW